MFGIMADYDFFDTSGGGGGGGADNYPQEQG